MLFAPVYSFAQRELVEIPDSVGGIGFGDTTSEADNEALMSLVRTLGVRVEVNTTNIVSENDGEITGEYHHSAEVESKIRNLTNTNMMVSKQPDGLYKVVRWVNPRKYVSQRIYLADSLYREAIVSPNGYDYVIRPNMGNIRGRFSNKLLNFRLGFLYMAYQIRNDELISYFVPENEIIKNEIKSLAKLWSDRCKVVEVTGENFRFYEKGLQSKISFAEMYLSVLCTGTPATGLGCEIEYSTDDSDIWRHDYEKSRKSEADTTSHEDIAISVYGRGIDRRVYSKQKLLFRIPYYYLAKGEVKDFSDTKPNASYWEGRPVIYKDYRVVGNCEVRTIDVPDDWYSVKEVEKIPKERLMSYIEDDYNSGLLEKRFEKNINRTFFGHD